MNQNQYPNLKAERVELMKMINFKRSRSHFQKGFSMVEILVSVLVIGVGLVGTVGISLTSLSSTADGQFNSQATIIAEELAEMMRGNLVAYESSSFVATPSAIEKICAPDEQCTSAEQAQYDTGKWLEHAAGVLPGGVAVLCMDSTPDDGQPAATACDGLGLNTLKVFWRDTRNDEGLAEGETFQRYVLSVIP